MNHFDFLYCCLYKWSEKVNGRGYPNAYSASLMMSFILMLVGGALFTVAVVPTGVNILSLPAGQVIAGLLPIVVFVIVHRYFSRPGRLSRKLRDFDESKGSFRDKPGAVVVTALGSALLLLFVVWALVAQLNKPI